MIIKNCLCNLWYLIKTFDEHAFAIAMIVLADNTNKKDKPIGN